MSHHLLIAENLYFSYPDGTQALKNISFTIKHGESVGLIGPNGAGKSTLVMQLNGYLKPTKGKVIVGETELTNKTKEEIRKRIGVVFQNPDHQLFMPTVYEDVAFGPANMGLSRETIDKQVTKALETVDCLSLKHIAPYHLSEGQKRSVSIATVLSMQPDILIMDEPSSNLDSYTRRKLINFLKGFSHTKLLVSHDLDLIREVCDRCLLLYEGELKKDGPVKEILQDEKLLTNYKLELPLTLQR